MGTLGTGGREPHTLDTRFWRAATHAGGGHRKNIHDDLPHQGSSRRRRSGHHRRTRPQPDFGSDRSLNRNTQKISLRHGSFLVDATRLNRNITFKASNVGCSGVAAGIGRGMPISHGAGAYAAISRTVTIRVAFVEIGKEVNGKVQPEQGRGR